MSALSRKPLIIDGTVVTVAVSDEAQEAFAQWTRENIESFDEAMKPFGLRHDDITMPQLERFVREEDMPTNSGRNGR